MTIEERLDLLEKDVAELKIVFQSLDTPTTLTLTDALNNQLEELRTTFANHISESESIFNDHQQQIDLKAACNEVPQIELSGSTLQFTTRA